MLRVATLARRKEPDLADALIADAATFGAPPLGTEAIDVYEEIEHCVADRPDLGFGETIRLVSRTLGLSPSNVRRRYPRARRVYERGRCAARS